MMKKQKIFKNNGKTGKILFPTIKMNRAYARTRSGYSGPATVAWMIPNHNLEDQVVKDAVDQVAEIMASKDFQGPKIDKKDGKTIITFVAPGKPAFKDALYLASLLPLQFDEPVEMWFALKWMGASDAEDGKFDVKIQYRLGQWMAKICYEHETQIGDEPAFAMKKWVMRL